MPGRYEMLSVSEQNTRKEIWFFLNGGVIHFGTKMRQDDPKSQRKWPCSTSDCFSSDIQGRTQTWCRGDSRTAKYASCAHNDDKATFLCIECSSRLGRYSKYLMTTMPTWQWYQRISTEASGGTMVSYPVLQVQTSEVDTIQLISMPVQSSRKQNCCLDFHQEHAFCHNFFKSCNSNEQRNERL